MKVQKKADEPRYLCVICGKVLEANDNFASHKVSCHQEPGGSFVKNVINNSKKVAISEDKISVFVRVP